MSIPSNPIEYLIYYERKPDMRRPVAVLLGSDWTQVNNDSENKDLKNNGIISIHLNNGHQKIETHLTQVKHSNDLLIINSNPKTDSVIYIYGEKGDGLKVGSKALIKITGVLVIIKSKDDFYVLESGRHTIESSNDLKFKICGDHRVMLSGTDFKIDDESYLESDIQPTPQSFDKNKNVDDNN